MMVEDRKPIGGSNEDTFFTKGDSLRSKYKKQMNTIYLGSERDLENVEAVHEADEEDDPSPTAIMACIAQLDRPSFGARKNAISPRGALASDTSLAVNKQP